MNNESQWKYASFLLFGLIIAIITLFLCLGNKQTDEVYVEPAVPSSYHILYDDNEKMIIVPQEYHFHYDKNGHLVLTTDKNTDW